MALTLICSVIFCFVSTANSESNPSIRAFLKPETIKPMVQDKEIKVSAKLEDVIPSTDKKYTFYASMFVGAGEKTTRETLTNYPLYSQMIPYIDKVQYEPKTKILQLEGGLWKFRLVSTIQFFEKSPQWIHYEIIAGHFKGMSGGILFESEGEKGTLVYFNGSLSGAHWPPRFIIEEGAKIVFGYTGQRMRSYIESQKRRPESEPSSPDPNRSEIPKPRSRFKQSR